jgi:hypothetical protein
MLLLVFHFQNSRCATSYFNYVVTANTIQIRTETNASTGQNDIESCLDRPFDCQDALCNESVKCQRFTRVNHRFLSLMDVVHTHDERTQSQQLTSTTQKVSVENRNHLCRTLIRYSFSDLRSVTHLDEMSTSTQTVQFQTFHSRQTTSTVLQQQGWYLYGSTLTLDMVNMCDFVRTQ